MRAYRSRPRPGSPGSLPHGDAREKRQPYAAEHEDYNDGVATPPEEGGGDKRAARTPVDRETGKTRPEGR
jgi:hypothetical protein